VEWNIFDIIGGLGLDPINDPDPISRLQMNECKKYEDPYSLTVIGKWYDLTILWVEFAKNGIRYNGRTDNYCGPKSLTNLTIAHIPYQASIMGMWENLAEGVVYFIPTKKNYIKIYLNAPTRWPFQGTVVPQEEELFRADWWHKNYSHLFIYWDSIKELTKLNNNLTLVNEKREIVYKFIKEHRIQALAQWRRVFLDWNL